LRTTAAAGAWTGTLRSALIDPLQASAIEVRGTIPSAVLVALYERDGQPWTVLTERRSDLTRHAGEISFPGGRRDEGDASLVDTALREASEEIGLDPTGVEILGALQPTPTIATGYAIYPFVGLITDGNVWNPSQGEVAQMLEMPLAGLAAGYGRRKVPRRGIEVWTDTYVLDGHLVWGATARILSDLLDRIAR